MAQDFATSYTTYLRKSSKFRCPVFDCAEFADNREQLRTHLQSCHQDVVEKKDINLLLQEAKRGGGIEGVKRTTTDRLQQSSSSQDPGGGQIDSPGDKNEGNDLSPNKRRKSPDLSIKGRPRSLSPYRRSRARVVSTTPNDPDFRRSPQQLGKLWNPDDATPFSSPRPRLPPSRQPRNLPTTRRSDTIEDDEESTKIIKQPETRPISQEQLIAEVKGIYAGLVMVESKCIEVDNAQSSQSETKLNNEQWQALIALHRTLLHEHHDFFLASQHPSASVALRRLASKYAMPARMWRHGIHSFLELLRHRLPHSLEHMLTFIYLAYSMMALLYETVPAFEDTWIECLGDLGRYRMAIEDDDIRDREVWTAVSRHWYSKASDKAPTTGRLYHHLAILARPSPLQQLYYYTKSLCVPIPFSSARESIMTLFDPILDPTSPQHSRLTPVDVAFVKLHAILFSNKLPDEFHPTLHTFTSTLNHQIGRNTRKWMEAGYHIAISNCCALLLYGQDDSVLLKAIRPQQADETVDSNTDNGESLPEYKLSKREEGACELFQGTSNVVFNRVGDLNDEKFPRQDKEPTPRPLPEDFAMKGLVWVAKYFPTDWYSNDKIDDDEKYFEVASMTDDRKIRILWLGCRIAKFGKWLTYDEATHQFGVAPEYEVELDNFTKDEDILVSVSEAAAGPTSQASTLSTFSATISGSTSDRDDEDMMDVDEALSCKPIIRQ
ncbi:uncharacterized protein GGS25DRAFT_524775 [Hypoxylon fragiforme]|uniref:uncharacterized protein n=1 Tax=Hypoxylon fragiforme TaxID=63214 RepID=UPI0020C637E8|nr:uncharacterized protein GGS25DRAFT_524775 [Hypoxylon fragiforme]KAI2605255.1 hypothetical protein GGS25DRAFT_524775 [Hypoxylon fragiforme]